jgi:hypothetical protein
MNIAVRRANWRTLLGWLLFAFILVAAVVLSGCTDNSAAIRTVKAHGFTNVEITGWAPLSCGDDDTSKTGFRARNRDGQMVEGAVCCGLVFKNCTLRIE